MLALTLIGLAVPAETSDAVAETTVVETPEVVVKDEPPAAEETTDPEQVPSTSGITQQVKSEQVAEEAMDVKAEPSAPAPVAEPAPVAVPTEEPTQPLPVKAEVQQPAEVQPKKAVRKPVRSYFVPLASLSSRKRRLKPVSKFSPSHELADDPPVKQPKVTSPAVAPAEAVVYPSQPQGLPPTPGMPAPIAPPFYSYSFDQDALAAALQSQQRQYEIADIQSQAEAAKRDLHTSLLEGRRPRNKALSISQFAPELMKGTKGLPADVPSPRKSNEKRKSDLGPRKNRRDSQKAPEGEVGRAGVRDFGV